MAFPFYWIGAATAFVFLGAAMFLFGIAVKLLSLTTAGVRGTVLPGLVNGFRDWTDEAGRRVRLLSPRADEGEAQPDETSEPVSSVERLQATIR
jgi:hypothetical protein